ncbi:Dynein axonemal heavy chain 6, partial [Pseudolycoriella hygida]
TTDYVESDNCLPFHIPHKKRKETDDNETKSSIIGKRKKGGVGLRTIFDACTTAGSGRSLETIAKSNGFVDINHLIKEKIISSKEYCFIYLTYAIPRSSEHFTPYSLKEAKYSEIDRNEFFTVDREGVAYFSRYENHFTKLQLWLTEYDLYLKMIKLRTFAKYRLWKGFKTWQKTVHWRKYLEARQFLEDKLFIANPWLARAILLLRKEYCEFVGMCFIDETTKQNFEVFYFIEVQMAAFEACKNTLMDFRNSTAEVLFDACHTAISKKGFQPVDEELTYITKKKIREMASSYVYRAQKRRFCLLLTKYKSFKLFADLLTLHDVSGPSEYELLNTVIDKTLELPRPSEYPQKSLLIGRLVLTPEKVEIDPSREVTTKIFTQLKDLMWNTICHFESFQSDPAYHLFTENYIFETIDRAYDKLELYVKRFEPIRENFEKDFNTKHETLKAQRDVNEFRSYLTRYTSEMIQLDGMLLEINLGLFLVTQTIFKEKFISVAKHLLDVLCAYLPKITIETVAILSEKAGHTIAELNTLPTTTQQFVNYFHYLENCQEKIQKLFADIDFASEYFDLMEEFNISIDDSEKEVFQGSRNQVQNVQYTWQTKCEEKGALLVKFENVLTEDIRQLFEEVSAIQEDVNKDWLIDESSNIAQVKECLTNLSDRLSVCMSQMEGYRNFQKEFKMNRTRVDALDLAQKDIKLRQMLWETSDEWENSMTTWYSEPFNNINIEIATSLTAKTLKNCTMFEKNFPENAIVAKVRKSAEVFKEKLPVLGYLRNPALKGRHWFQIEQLLGLKILSDDSITLETFEKANVLETKVAEQMAKICEQAAAEFDVEGLLKKVESLWEEFNLSVVQHRDAKDVYILGGVDELQIALDEAYININTILASPHVGPFKDSVLNWQAALNLFAENLDEWTQCQNNWIYFEGIFSAPDIQRQLPSEARLFNVVDKNWKDVMRRCYKMPLALPIMTDPNVLKIMKHNNFCLEQVNRSLNSYLEMKRVSFPRFYFLSNDELLEILAQTRNPHAVQPYLRKCFDAMARIEFGVKKTVAGKMEQTDDILAMISPGLRVRGAVDEWLSHVEQGMFEALKRCTRIAYKSYSHKDRSLWFQDHASQVVLTVSQQQWASDVHDILDGNVTQIPNKMMEFQNKLRSDLNKLTEIARSDIFPLLRKVLCALITIDVHAMETISNLIKENVTDSTDFNWVKMLRYYWVKATETIDVQMSSTNLPYFYEYLGAGGVLIITPLTDRCYLCLMGALQMDLGGSIAGPAGTGKTETTKDLAKALAKHCIVFNCSDGLDYKIMGQFFSGLAQSGAWCCFDEFNRIDIEVLSVIAQQLITIKIAKSMRMTRFMFEGNEIKLNNYCATFITMNPGYAGRSELPDNLRALFRPISMMVPDYTLIAEVILYSEGFESSHIMAKKMVQMYKLCSEQLSQQDHYDFGMRAVKSVLVMAGALKRSKPEQSEDVTLITALRDSNLPKFLALDVPLFIGILGDLFPGIDLPIVNYGELKKAIENCYIKKGLQMVPAMTAKTIQLYETMEIRSGVMLVGLAASGKTSILHTLAGALTQLLADGISHPLYRSVKIRTLNPKAVSSDELYGYVNSTTLEWKDGLMGLAIRSAVAVTDEIHQWIVCDGPVDAVWIENLNTVLDDNKMLCLANSERIKLTPWIHMVFEVQDLAQASPATVSRCGMIYVDPRNLGWFPLVESWRQASSTDLWTDELLDFVVSLFSTHVDGVLHFANLHCSGIVKQVSVSKIRMMCTLLTAMASNVDGLNYMNKRDAKSLIVKMFTYAMLWSIGGCFDENSKQKLEEHVVEVIRNDSKVKADDSCLPIGSLWDYKVNLHLHVWEDCLDFRTEYSFDPSTPFFDILVPTKDTARYGHISEILHIAHYPLLYTGETGGRPCIAPGMAGGVGKSVLAKQTLKRLSSQNIIPVFMSFSAQTSSSITQEMIESRLEKREKKVRGPPIGKTMVFFIDDVNMPKLDTYGSVPAIELLRQLCDCKGFYDRDKLFWKGIKDTVLGCACGPPGGGRNALAPRFVRHFAVLELPKPNNSTLTTIFSGIIKGFLADFKSQFSLIEKPISNAMISIYDRISKELLPTPQKSHYVFNLRDLSKLVQGFLQADSSNYDQEIQLLRLLYHESLRVFQDRLVNDDDKNYFKKMLDEICQTNFPTYYPIVKTNETVMFGDFMLFGQAKENRIYEEIKDMDKLKSVLVDYMEDYNTVTGLDVTLILFQDAIEHVTRLARLLRGDRGNGLLIGKFTESHHDIQIIFYNFVGLSGMGKQSLTRLAAHINNYQIMQIELSRGYDYTSFRDDLRKFYWNTGVANRETVFLITDTQIVKEEFMEDIQNILNSGEVPNLFLGDDYERVILGVKDDCVKSNPSAGDYSRDAIFEFFLNRARTNLRICCCMSPIGEAFRRRLQMFPSLVNCCTIDWFVNWSTEALYSVAFGSLADIAADETQNDYLSQICVTMHESVEIMTKRLYNEYRRNFYTTPSSYLELLKLYHSLLESRNNTIRGQQKRIGNGLNKILETNDVIEVMRKKLEDLTPQLEKEAADFKVMVEKIAVENKKADAMRKIVMKDEAAAREKEAGARLIADEARRDLQVVQPIIDAAQEALKQISKNDINEIKSFTSPPPLVKFVMEAVCLLFDVKPTWDSAKKLMVDTNFLKRLMTYDKEHTSEAILKKVRKYTQDKEFDPNNIGKVSKVAKSMAMWVIAMDEFSKVYKEVEPKIKKAAEADAVLKEVMAELKQKQLQLAAVEAELKVIQMELDEKNRQLKESQDTFELNSSRLNRAGRLKLALSDEEVRWGETVKNLKMEAKATVGDVLVAAALIAYTGAFPASYRKQLTDLWVGKCSTFKIPSSERFDFIGICGHPYEIRTWQIHFLPRDELSTSNGIIVTKAKRWPLMIDPQEQANRWIRSMESENNLAVVKLTDSNFLRVLEACIRAGNPILIEELYETIDPSLSPVLSRNIIFQNGRKVIRLGDSFIDYNDNFKLYMTTKLANPHYLPEVCISVTLVDFLITREGLEDQLLGEIVTILLPKLEEQRSELILQINNDKQQLVMLEDKVLKLLFSSSDNILDDEELVETLNDMKETSVIIADRLLSTEENEVAITADREKFRPLAIRGTILYFVIASLSEIDPMYQFSLNYFLAIFCAVISSEDTPADTELSIRLNKLLAAQIYAFYLNISRGLFERHNLIFSFMLAIATEKQEKRVTDLELQYLLQASIGNVDNKVKLQNSNVSERVWNCCLYLQNEFHSFKGLCNDLTKNIQIQIGDYSNTFSFNENSDEKEDSWNRKLNQIQKLMIIKTFAPDQLVLAVTYYVKEILGENFIEAIPCTLTDLYKDTSSKFPLIFILSAGSDPMASLQKFAKQMNYLEKFHTLSLGQGQGPAAEKLIETGCKFGTWVFLQNCHLATSFMPQMDIILRRIALGEVKTHDDFRIYLSSMPTNAFPVNVLQNAIKVTSEPPKGVKSNLIRGVSELNPDYFEHHILQKEWRALVFGVVMFHSIILERRKFGPLGWNILYEFTDSDRECALKILDVYCKREKREKIPWKALEYINSQITWGGRVTDFWDQRCLTVILNHFCSENTAKKNYIYSKSGVYACPEGKTVEAFKSYVYQLPATDDPDVFGMHENANLIFRINESKFFMDTMNTVQGKSRQSETSASDCSDDDIVLDSVARISENVAAKISLENPYPILIREDNKGRVPPLTTVLFQEVDRYNKLLCIIHNSLDILRKGIKGLIVMSVEYERIYKSLLNNEVPQLWSLNGFKSTKSLGCWVQDLLLRIDFIQVWVDEGQPKSSWLSGLFFPQSFLSGVLQTFARKKMLPIDGLSMDFEVLPQTVCQSEVYNLRKNGKKVADLYKNIIEPDIGIVIHGLLIEAGRWDPSKGGLCDANYGELLPSLPVLWLKPCTSVEIGSRYQAPLYKTQQRAGILSTTGASDNFILSVLLESNLPPEFWIMRGTALVTGVTE